MSNPYYPCLQEFKRWYFEARETGRSQKYLDRIQELAENFKAQTPNAINDATTRNPEVTLSEAAISHLKQDAATYQSQIEQFAKDAKTILKYKGKQIVLKGQPVYEYRLARSATPKEPRNQEYLLRYHCTTKVVTVEKLGRSLLHYPAHNQAQQKTVTHEDFGCFHQEATRLREQAKMPPTSLNFSRFNEPQR